ncbi:hypothetical protein G9F71_008460 [Clostridium sp. FP2]|uniref:hypothetical protein n=1 Tax=Clostridium sp. FP2 TaxID=2724481 RepID=UPI0013E90E81|nr:hypothetical protein [Clostridium sp. FP2]MBZ9622884.1 hypothetical protein [Clostridium sp. FP2]
MDRYKKGFRKDLRISYENENGNIIKRNYTYITDFLNEMESDNIDIPMLDYTNVIAILGENIFNQKQFNTISDLLKYIKNNIIIKI